MRTQRFVYGLLAVVVVLGLFPTIAGAADPGKKLTRGAANTVTGWVELPKEVIQQSSSDNLYVGTTYGLADGLTKGIQRTLYGVWDGVTFLIPPYEKPALKPETLLSE